MKDYICSKIVLRSQFFRLCNINILFYRVHILFVCQVDELISDALKCETVSETVSKRATQEIESFNGFLTDTKASFKVCTVVKSFIILYV